MVDGWMMVDGWIDGWKSLWMDRWMGECTGLQRADTDDLAPEQQQQWQELSAL